MSSQSQIDANRRNAQLSTGPRTEEGKAAVSHNAFKHGLRSAAYLAHQEEPEYYHAICDQLLAQYQPQTITEEIFVERIALCESKLAAGEEKEFANLVDDQALALTQRRQDLLERAEERAVKLLHKLQKERKADEAKAQLQAQAQAHAQARAEVDQAVAGIQKEMAILSSLRTPAQIIAFEEAEAAAAAADPDIEPITGLDEDEPAAS